MKQPVAFVGLGNMGTPMARNLLKGGYPLYVYNRSKDKAKPLTDEGAKLLNEPKEAFEKVSIVITMLANDQALEAVSTELLKTIKPGDLHISMSTVSPDTNRKLAEFHEKRGALFCSAPVFGRPDAAAAAKLTIGSSGKEEAKKIAHPLLQLLGQKIEDFGTDPGHANIAKVIGNFMLISAIETIGEALTARSEWF